MVGGAVKVVAAAVIPAGGARAGVTGGVLDVLHRGTQPEGLGGVGVTEAVCGPSREVGLSAVLQRKLLITVSYSDRPRGTGTGSRSPFGCDQTHRHWFSSGVTACRTMSALKWASMAASKPCFQ